MKKIMLIVFLFSFIFISCSNEDEFFDPTAVRLPPNITFPESFADKNLNQQTKDLYNRLLNSTQKGIAFGQQQPFGTGNNFPVEDKLEEDFFEVAGDYMAVAGFDLELIGLQPEGRFLDRFVNQFAEKVIQAHNNGSLITFSWHFVNPNRLSFNGDEILDGVVGDLLEGGKYRTLYLERLRRASKLFNKLIDSSGNPIPVLFRPWHEMNGDFFFWGEGFRSTLQYIQLWKDTVRILSENHNVHNLLYVYAPNFVNNSTQFLKNYPGDEFVDMLGIDVYDFRNRNFLTTAINNLQIVEQIATEKNMLFALTETGLTNLVNINWWTESLYKAIRSSSASYVMIWRNDTTTFFHAPYLGHPSEVNFKEFLDKELILLSEDIL